MTRRFCFSLVATAAALTSISGCSRQDKDPPKQEPPKNVANSIGMNFANSIGMKFVWIPPGSFKMGSPKDEKERQPWGTDETEHKVTLTRGFYMGAHTVTQEQWKEVMGNNPSRQQGQWRNSRPGARNLPVENVSWEDCQEFCKKLRDKDKKPYRLPTEAEWEYSCRAGTTTPFHFGNTISTDVANYDGNSYTYGNSKHGENRKTTMPVGSFPPNAFGLYEMHGNVWQLCQDWYGEYPKEEVVDPQGPEKGGHRGAPENGEGRVQRGGSWWGPPWHCRSACRGKEEPGNLRTMACGFRVCFFVE
jgi:sulfatase modifying factor 1